MIMNLPIIHKFGLLLAAVERAGDGCVLCIVVVQSKRMPCPALKTSCHGNKFFYIIIRYELGLDRPASASSNSIFKGLSSRLRPLRL
jgi:hypothetical protein